jgi:hypothetical protein
MSYLPFYVFICAYVCPKHCVEFLFCFSSSYVLYIVSFSELSLQYSLTFVYPIQQSCKYKQNEREMMKVEES